MKKQDILIGVVVGLGLAYLLFKPKATTLATTTKANASGYGCACGKPDCDCKKGFTKNPKAPQSQPYIATYGSPNISGVPIHAGFSYPEKNLFQESPFKH
jgi:hypothetical protein